MTRTPAFRWPRFSLRTILIVFGIACLILGWYAVRERRRTRLFDARQRIVEAIASFYGDTPPGWSVTDSRMAKLTAILPLRIGSEKAVAKDADDAHVDQIMEKDSGGLSTCWIPLKSDSPIKVQDENLPIEWMDAREHLSKHYGSKLVAAGMTQAAPGSFIDDQSESAVFIEVNRAYGPVDAMVTVIFYAPRP